MDGTSIQNEVILGVDTHLDTHVGVVINRQSKVIGTLASVPTNAAGYLKLLTWARSLGDVRRAGVEGTGTYGAGLARLFHEQGIEVLEIFGVEPQTATILIAVAGDNPERLRNEAALAALCEASPLQASSGKTARHQLNRGGDRSANNALWTIAMVRMRSEPRTQAYVMRRTAQGMSQIKKFNVA